MTIRDSVHASSRTRFLHAADGAALGQVLDDGETASAIDPAGGERAQPDGAAAFTDLEFDVHRCSFRVRKQNKKPPPRYATGPVSLRSSCGGVFSFLSPLKGALPEPGLKPWPTFAISTHGL